MAKPASAIGSETDLLMCPYNESHLILRKRFQVHLIRCRRSYPNAPMVVCPFNVTHRINKVELDVSTFIYSFRKYCLNLFFSIVARFDMSRSSEFRKFSPSRCTYCGFKFYH